VFLDESGFFLTPTMRRTLAPCGCTPVLEAWDRRDKLSAISAITVSLLAGRTNLLIPPGKALDGKTWLEMRRRSFSKRSPMRTLSAFLLAFLGCTVLGASAVSAQAIDLSKIERTIRKEPVYKGKPKYWLLVFGPKAKTRVWLVLDGDVLYVDRNGDGDLTGAGKRIEANGKSPTFLRFEFPIPSSNGKTQYGRTEVHIRRGGQIYVHLMEPWYLEQVTVLDPPRAGESAEGAAIAPPLAGRPQDAPIIHLDGPLHLQLINGSSDKAGNFHPSNGFVRGDKPCPFLVRVVTPGLGKHVYAALNFRPKAPPAVAEIVFPNRDPAGKPIVVKVPVNPPT
jgi:hypothetical protein